ncbi:T-cell ecto-ADP-ribosyltransferase 1-like [Parambassis ranga]|uniref:NAD(P)(+)--arginine ADP-ribosyltransferase n=1 Tax=Parambassis ranga TaxID=210632 RepID=A0A6P7I3M9_9TELE|nr:T-cell ecto-ADP-ribosyltransferase 1-like [Parambassis ranga]
MTSLSNCATLCVLCAVLLLLYDDPFLILWWPQRPAERPRVTGLPLDMAPHSIDDMHDGCRTQAASAADLFGVRERHYDRNLGFAWTSAESEAKKPVHMYLKVDHAIVLHMYTKIKHIRQQLMQAVKTEKHKYSTDGFKFHYFYFYLTDAIQVLRHSQMPCRTTYHRTWRLFNQNTINANMRFGAFTWSSSNKHSFESDGNVSCFEIYTCFGADITYYSNSNQQGQVLIPTYEVFTITDVLMNEPWCRVVYKLQSTKTPKTDLNCRLNRQQQETYFGTVLSHWQRGGVVLMSACVIVLMISSFIIVKHKQKCYLAAVLAALLGLILIVLMLI